MISTSLPPSEQALFFVGIGFCIYLLLVGLGRTLKRRAGLKLGAAFQLLALVLAAYLPFLFFHGHPVFPGILKLRELYPNFPGMRSLRAASILLGSFFILALIRRYLWEGYFEQNRKIVIPRLLRDLVAILVVVVAAGYVLAGVYGEGKTITGLLAGSGIAAVVIGFAMQDLLGNIISGISLQISRTFSEGDWLKIDNQYAEVMEVNWRSTRLRTNDYIFLEIPNSYIVKNTVVNLNYHTKEYAMRMRIGIDYNVPPNLVKEALLQATSCVAGVLATPPPKVFLVEYADSSVIYEIKFWMNNHSLFNNIWSAIHTNCWYELKRRNIKIPFPIRTLQIDRTPTQPGTVSEHDRARLRKKSFFQCLEDAQMEKLFSLAPVCRYGKEEAMVRQGANGDSMFVILRGSAGVFVDQHGGQTRVATLGEGEYFGEMSLLTGEPRTATVTALVDCEVLKVDKDLLADIVQHGPELLPRIGELLAQRKIETDGAIASLADRKQVQAAKDEYKASFLSKLSKMFEL